MANLLQEPNLKKIAVLSVIVLATAAMALATPFPVPSNVPEIDPGFAGTGIALLGSIIVMARRRTR